MTTLAQQMLAVAEHIGNVRRGTATGGSMTTLIDKDMQEGAEHWAGGTLWMLTGDNAGLCVAVIGNAVNTLTINTTLTTAIAAGDTYAVADRQFPLEQLKAAVNRAYLTIDTTTKNSTATLNNDEVIELPDGVADVRRVVVEDVVNHYWEEIGGYIIFADGKEPSSGDAIELWYPAALSALVLTDVIDDNVNPRWLLYAAAVNLWRWHLQKVNKDDPIAQDMLNEAKQMEAGQRPLKKPLMGKDMIYAGW